MMLLDISLLMIRRCGRGFEGFLAGSRGKFNVAIMVIMVMRDIMKVCFYRILGVVWGEYSKSRLSGVYLLYVQLLYNPCCHNL